MFNAYVFSLLMCLALHFVTSKVHQPIKTEITPQIYELASMIPYGKTIAFWSIDQISDIADEVISAIIKKEHSITIIVGEKFISAKQFELIIIVGGEVS